MQIPRAQTPAIAALVLTLLCAAAPALAKPRIELVITQTKEVAETKNGARAVRMVPVKEAAPGDVLEYTLGYSNTGDEVARDAVIDDPIPKGATYQAGSATGEGAEISFSADGGKSYAPAVKLSYEIRLPSGQLERRTATPVDYTHLRWTVKAIPPGGTGKVTFRVRLNG